jgi:hypothetical protein
MWLNEDNGHQGVWIVDRSIESDMILNVPNIPRWDPYQESWLQVVYSAQNGDAPMNRIPLSVVEWVFGSKLNMELRSALICRLFRQKQLTGNPTPLQLIAEH